MTCFANSKSIALFACGAASLSLFGAVAGCAKKKESKGSPMGLGQLLIPVKASAPAALAAASKTASSLTESFEFAAPTELETLKDRFFKEGPNDFMYRLKSVDGRLAELDKRHTTEVARKCVTETPKEWSLSGLPDKSNTLTGTASFWLSCKEVLPQTGGGTLTILFGRKDGTSYLAEIQKAADDTVPTMFVLGKVDDASTKAEVWQVVLTKKSVTDAAKQHTSWLYILGDKANSNFELATGSSAAQSSTPTDSEDPTSGAGCGVRIKASSTLVYGIGRFHDAGTADGRDATAAACNDAEATVCASATDLTSKTAADCDAIKTFSDSVPKITYSQLKGSSPYAGYTKAKAILDLSGLPELTSFTEEAEKK